MGKEWEGTGKPLILFGGCNFRKGKYLCFCRESNSQCGGQGFDPLCSTNRTNDLGQGGHPAFSFVTDSSPGPIG